MCCNDTLGPEQRQKQQRSHGDVTDPQVREWWLSSGGAVGPLVRFDGSINRLPHGTDVCERGRSRTITNYWPKHL